MYELGICEETRRTALREALVHQISIDKTNSVSRSDAQPVRSLFLSDLHLGFRYSRVGEVLEFLKRYEPEYLYIVGDFIDGWSLSREWHWCSICDEIILRLVGLSERGTRIFLTVGNHDRFLRSPMLQSLVRLSRAFEVNDRFHHRSADGRGFIVVHGDQFDEMEKLPVPLATVLCRFYELMLMANHLWARLICSKHIRGQSLSSGLRANVGWFLKHLKENQMRAIRFAQSLGCDGIICGHVHSPKLVEHEGVVYINTGDWIENCTACIEDQCGKFRIVRYEEP
ncbi:MAG: UDP-2,3-diacylglucosamine diphosphatase [Planctomyces sp.]|nr:UDP-2,3-diacylglucosamine diphosphatase [Planctomyces sp.]